MKKVLILEDELNIRGFVVINSFVECAVTFVRLGPTRINKTQPCFREHKNKVRVAYMRPADCGWM